MPVQHVEIDQWSYFDYKSTFAAEAGGGLGSWMAPSWIGDHFRRLQAYKLLESYFTNSSRFWLGDGISEEERNTRREYGDAAVMVQTIKSSLIGDQQNIKVDGATETSDGGDDSAPAGADEQQELLNKWSDDEQFLIKVSELEEMAIKLGDAVMVLNWSNAKQRPTLEVWDPGFYFPVLDPESITTEYPRKIHIAYEFERYDQRSQSYHTFVRRLTWELKDSRDDAVDNGFAYETGKPYRYPWNGKEPVYDQCFFSDAEWEIGDIGESDPDYFDENKAVWDVDEMPLNIDFIPLLHMPNSIAGSNHYGTSSLAYVPQMLDDLISTDTDLQASSATTGSPPIAISGGVVDKNERGTIDSYGPGTVLETGDGNATVIDTSKSLDALIKYDEHLLSRVAVNARIPESLMGRIKPSEVPSGIALTLSFSPHTSMIVDMRKVRREKYRLLLKFVSRMFMNNKDLKEIHNVELTFGSFLPSDKKGTLELVALALGTNPPSLSIETCIRMLMEAGFPIESASAEVERILSRDYESASALLAAGGQLNEARDLLGLKPIENPQPETDPTDEPDPQNRNTPPTL